MDNKNNFNDFDTKDYDLDNFDVDGQTSDKEVDNYDTDGVAHKVSTENSADIDDETDEYGDDFDSQTGEDNTKTKVNVYDDSVDEYYFNRQPIESKLKENNGKKIAIILSIVASVCVIVALLFAITQCSKIEDTEKKPTTTSATTSVVETTAYQTQAQQEETTVYEETEAPTTEPVTEPTIVTEAPTEAVEETTVPEVVVPDETIDDGADEDDPVVEENFE